MSNRTSQQADRRRHARRRVLIPARMKHGAGWSDVCIRDISAKGLLVQASAPPQRGSYVELRRGAHIIIAKVAWNQEQQCGLATQDLLPIDAIIQNPQAAGFGLPQAGGPPGPERRSAPRTASASQAHALSRHLSAMMQFGFAIVIALVLAVALVTFVRDAFNQSLASVTASLDGKPPPSSSGGR